MPFNATKYMDPKNQQLTETQKLMLRYFEDLDQQVKRMNGDEETNENFFTNNINVAPGIGGYSLKDMSTSTKIISFLVCLGFFSFIFHFGKIIVYYNNILAYKRLFTPKETPFEKAKKNKQEKKSKNKKTA